MYVLVLKSIIMTISFRHPLFPTRLLMLVVLMDSLHSHSFQNTPAQIFWKDDSSTSFIVHSQYKMLQPPQFQDKAAKIFWKAKAPLKVKIITWLAVLDRLPTGLYLQRRHIRSSSPCVLCDYHPESSAHIFLFCHFSKRVWAPILSGLALSSWLISLRDLWEDWQVSSIPDVYRKTWDSRVLAVVWPIWIERNTRIFDQKWRCPVEVSHWAIFFSDLSCKLFV